MYMESTVERVKSAEVIVKVLRESETFMYYFSFIKIYEKSSRLIPSNFDAILKLSPLILNRAASPW